MTKTAIVRRLPRRAPLVANEPLLGDFGRFFGEDFFRPSSLWGRPYGEELQSSWLPAVDVEETDDAYVFSAELAGLNKDDVEISLEDNVLTLSGERKSEQAKPQKIEIS